MSTSTFPPPSSMPPPFNDRLLYAYYLNLAKAERGDIVKHQLYVKWECQVTQHPKKAPKQWGVAVKGKGLIDYYDTREEATKRAFCCSLMLQDESSGKLEAVRKNLQERVMKNKLGQQTKPLGAAVQADTEAAEKAEAAQKAAADAKAAAAKAAAAAADAKAAFADANVAAAAEERKVGASEPAPKEAAPKVEPKEGAAPKAEAPAAAVTTVAPSKKPEVTIVDNGSDTETDTSVTNEKPPAEKPKLKPSETKEEPPKKEPTVAKDEPAAAPKPPPEPTKPDTIDVDASPPAPPAADPPVKPGLLPPVPAPTAPKAIEASPAAEQTTSDQTPAAAVVDKEVATKRKLSADIAAGEQPPAKKPRQVEMRDPVRGTVREVFTSSDTAGRVTHIKTSKIEKACEDGGGLVQGQFFRYHDDSGADDDDVEMIGPIPEKAPSASLVVAAAAPQPTPAAAAAAAAATKPPHPQHALLLTPNKPKTRPLPPKGRTMPSAKPKAATTPAQHDGFDLSTLKPVRKKTKPSMRPKKTIELVDSRNHKVLVCFRGATDVCRALDMDRKEVTVACESYSKHVPSTFGSFALRYAQPGHYAAYVYGDHQEDYKKKSNETHETLAKRYRKTYEAEKAAGILGDTPDFIYGNSNKSTEEKKPTISKKEVMNQPTELIEESIVSREKVDASSTKEGLDATLLCLVCQTVPPRVVFEPCYHSVVCFSCAEATCKTFCPACRVPIKSRIQPKAAILVRPRIFSAYSFM